MIKGIKIERGLPSNFLDVYALFKEMVKEGCHIYPKPTPEQVKAFNFRILDALKNPHEFIFVARRGRAYVGFIYGMVLPRDFGPNYTGYCRMLFVNQKKRKLGVGEALTDTLLDTFKKLGLTTVEFNCEDALVDRYVKKNKAVKVLNYMKVDL